jgi:hypothetical protein
MLGWSDDNDEELKRVVEHHGDNPWSWAGVAEVIGGRRDPREVRNRFWQLSDPLGPPASSDWEPDSEVAPAGAADAHAAALIDGERAIEPISPGAEDSSVHELVDARDNDLVEARDDEFDRALRNPPAAAASGELLAPLAVDEQLRDSAQAADEDEAAAAISVLSGGAELSMPQHTSCVKPMVSDAHLALLAVDEQQRHSAQAADEGEAAVTLGVLPGDDELSVPQHMYCVKSMASDARLALPAVDEHLRDAVLTRAEGDVVCSIEPGVTDARLSPPAADEHVHDYAQNTEEGLASDVEPVVSDARLALLAVNEHSHNPGTRPAPLGETLGSVPRGRRGAGRRPTRAA